MPASKTEQVVGAVKALLDTVPGVAVERNSVLPEKVSVGGLSHVEPLAQLHLRHEQNITTVVRPSPRCRAGSVARRKPRSAPLFRLNEARKPSTTRSDGPPCRGTNRSGPKRCSGKVRGLIRLPSVPFFGAFSVGIARKRPRLLLITAPSSNARTICGALV